MQRFSDGEGIREKLRASFLELFLIGTVKIRASKHALEPAERDLRRVVLVII